MGHTKFIKVQTFKVLSFISVYFIVRKMIFNSDVGEYNDYDKLTVMCAAFCYDIGHGPFSHCFEGRLV